MFRPLFTNASRRLSLGAYLSSLRSPVEFALMAADDPLPGLLDPAPICLQALFIMDTKGCVTVSVCERCPTKVKG